MRAECVRNADYFCIKILYNHRKIKQLMILYVYLQYRLLIQRHTMTNAISSAAAYPIHCVTKKQLCWLLGIASNKKDRNGNTAPYSYTQLRKHFLTDSFLLSIGIEPLTYAFFRKFSFLETQHILSAFDFDSTDFVVLEQLNLL